jgi:hypothetical protein
MQEPVIREVAITKAGRFWRVSTDGNLLAIVVYRKGAEAIQDLVQRLAGITVTPTANPPNSTSGRPAKRATPR